MRYGTPCKVALLATAISFGLPSTSPFAADKAVLVLDGSGSMWQQVGSTTKIEIARDVIGDLMLDWSDKVELGLSAYGHREKGNCGDIETLKPIGPVDPKEVAQIVDAISPKGKTPLTAAVRKAADELRFEEDRATVILVSDGEETCGGDPCAVARELEAAGIDFTVHVVGFDLTQEETANLQCIADNTGGKFLQASDAEELHQAMAVVKEVVVQRAQVDLVNHPQFPVGTEWVWKEANTGELHNDRVIENNGSQIVTERKPSGCVQTHNIDSHAGGTVGRKSYYRGCFWGEEGSSKTIAHSGSLFPMRIGASESGIVFDEKSGTQKKITCSVTGKEKVSVPAGTFDTYRVICKEPGSLVEHHYSPELGTRVQYRRERPSSGFLRVLQLVDFKRG